MSSRRPPSWVVRLVVGTSALLSAVGVRAQTPECRRIVSVPFTIDRPGVYCLGRNLSTRLASGSAITIASDQVVLDLKGFYLDGSAAGSDTRASGVRADDRRDVRVRNGVVRGFFGGVLLTSGASAQGYVVEGIAAEDNLFEGISVGGRGAVVRDSRVIRTGGSTAAIVRGNALGLVLSGPGSRALNNDVVGTFASPTAIAWSIHVANADGAVVEGNRVSGVRGESGSSYGIIVPFSQDVLVVSNRITGTTVGVAYSSDATGRYRDNLTAGVETPFFGTGTDAGNNQ